MVKKLGGIVLILASFLLAAFAHSVPAAPACESFKAGVASIRHDDPKVVVVELTPTQRAAVTRAYNSAPPATSKVFTHIYTLAPRGGTSLMVVFVQGADCVVDSVILPRSAFQRMLGQET